MKDTNSPQKKELKSLTDYQEGSIVSKTIVDKQNGSVTTFAFSEGQKLSEHTAPFDAMVMIVDGEAEIIIDKNVNHLSEGEMIIMPANIPHAVNANKKFKMILTMIKSAQ